MNYLVDTHVFLWWLSEPQKLSSKARKVISDQENQLYISSASFWELAIKKNLGKITFPGNIIELLEADNFNMLQISPNEALSVGDLPPIHNDPFDRMIVIQAKLLNLTLITHDDILFKYPVLILKA